MEEERTAPSEAGGGGIAIERIEEEAPIASGSGTNATAEQDINLAMEPLSITESDLPKYPNGSNQPSSSKAVFPSEKRRQEQQQEQFYVMTDAKSEKAAISSSYSQSSRSPSGFFHIPPSPSQTSPILTKTRTSVGQQQRFFVTNDPTGETSPTSNSISSKSSIRKSLSGFMTKSRSQTPQSEAPPPFQEEQRQQFFVTNDPAGRLPTPLTGLGEKSPSHRLAATYRPEWAAPSPPPAAGGSAGYTVSPQSTNESLHADQGNEEAYYRHSLTSVPSSSRQSVMSVPSSSRHSTFSTASSSSFGSGRRSQRSTFSSATSVYSANSIRSSSSSSAPKDPNGWAKRRMAAIGDIVEPLDFDSIPPLPEKRKGAGKETVTKVTDLQLRLFKQNFNGMQGRLEQRLSKVEEKLESEENRDLKKREKLEKKAQKEREKLNKRANKETEKLSWIVILPTTDKAGWKILADSWLTETLNEAL
ncbi:hypothetical protein BT69DRAFT_534936 [Atractiella rhizophila]|nr:hypothetical protein BT69DRAFT_534936 [Atractiella rhizophila]